MKQLLLTLTAGVLLVSCTGGDKKHGGAQRDSLATANVVPAAGSDSASGTTIQWLDSTSQDLGRVMAGAKVEVVYRFRNAGTKPLVIESANPGCGCTVAEKPEAPIPPGGEGRIRATFDSEGREGTNHKNVAVIANTNPPMHDLQFKVEVQKQ